MVLNDEFVGPIDLSADAILEIEEMNEGHRADAPSVKALFDFLRTPPSHSLSLNGANAVSMLDDVRAYGLLRMSFARAQPKKIPEKFADFRKLLEEYLSTLESGIVARDAGKIREAKLLCLALHENLMSGQLAEMYQRRERSDSRYLIDDSIQ